MLLLSHEWWHIATKNEGMSCDCWDSSKKDRYGTWKCRWLEKTWGRNKGNLYKQPFFRGSSCSFWGFQPSQISMFLWACLAHQKIHANWLWHLSSPLVPSGWPIHSCESGSYIQSVEDQVPFAAGRVPAYAVPPDRSQEAHQKHNPSIWFNFVYSHITYEYDKEICTTMYYITISI